MNIEDLIGKEFEGDLLNGKTTLMFLIYQSFKNPSYHMSIGFMEDSFGMFPVSVMVNGNKIKFRKHEDRTGFVTNVYKDYYGKVEMSEKGYVIKGEFVLSKDPNYKFRFEMKEKSGE